MSLEEIFAPLEFRNLTLKNRILRSNISGRFDDYDGTGTQTRINWELKFARGGVGAIVSSWCGVHRRGFIVPGYASIETDDRIPFWRELGRRVHEHGCPYILQLAFGVASATSTASSSNAAGARPTSPTRYTDSSASG